MKEKDQIVEIINDKERIDDLQIRGYHIIQNKEGFCFGIDAVLLSDYVSIKKGSRVVDLCSGTGIIPILLEAKYQLSNVKGIEYFPEYVEMAGRSIRMNGQEEKVSLIQGDIRFIEEIMPGGCADYVTCNPPYMIEDHGFVNDNFMKAAARHEILCSLKDVIKAADWLLKPKGHLALVHRPFRLAEILYECKRQNLEPKRMRLVYPYVDKEPNMVLIECIKGARQGILTESPLIVYNKDGSYTEEIHKIYGNLWN